MRPQPKYLVSNTVPRNNARNLLEFKHKHDTAFLGPFAKLEKATIIFVMSVCVCVSFCLSVYMPVCLSVPTHGTTRSLMDRSS
jgi:hypothetical protein